MIVQGNALNIPLEDCTVQCCVTSPPYFGLRDYNISGQLGLEDTPEEYIANLVNVFREVKRVLKDNAIAWLVIGDSYAGSGRGNNAKGKQGTNKGTLFDPSNAGYVPENLKPKDLMMIPARVALALQADGWWLRSEIVWHKPNPMPESVTDRPTKSHEMIYLLAKSAHYYYDSNAIAEQIDAETISDYNYSYENTSDEGSGQAVSGKRKGEGQQIGLFQNGSRESDEREMAKNGSGASLPIDIRTMADNQDESGDEMRYLRRNETINEGSYNASFDGGTTYDEEYSGTLPELQRSKGKSHKSAVTPGQTPQSKALKRMAGEKDPSYLTRNKRDVWEITTKPYKGAHFATYPPDLIEPCILAGTSEKGECPECGKAWKRVVETIGLPRNDKRTHSTENQRMGKTPAPEPVKGGNTSPISTTIGWRPQCDCGLDPVPQIVLDPFNGSGTTGEVAIKHGRKYVGVELNMEYIELSKKRIADTQIKLPIGETK